MQPLPDEAPDAWGIRVALIQARNALANGESLALAQRKLRLARDKKTTRSDSERQLRIAADQFLGRI